MKPFTLYLFTLYLFTLYLFTLVSCNTVEKQYKVIDGFALGTTYRIIYRDAEGRDLPAVDSLLTVFSRSLSIYDTTSIISRVNRNEAVEVDDYFMQVFNRSKEMYAISEGVFDISAAPLFDAWGFGFKHKEKVTPGMIDSLKTFVGMDKLTLDNRQIIKSDPRISVSTNAIAGYSVDVTAKWLETQGITDYLVEIGGEIRCAGKNKKEDLWRVGIDRPEDGNMVAGELLEAVVQFTGRAMATSGNYRKFYVEDGKKYAHTIDPRTGYPVNHNLLSATVYAADCMTADAYATVFMVVGLEQAKALLANHPELGAYLIYEEAGQMKNYATPNVQAMLRP